MIGLLAGPTSVAGRWAVLLLAVVFLAGWGWIERERRQSAEAALTEARATIAGRDRSIEQLNKRIADLAEIDGQRANLTRMIHAQPRTSACVSTPAVDALLRGLREPAAAAGGGAGGAAGVPPGAAGAGAGG